MPKRKLNNTLSEILGENIRTIRESSGLTGRELGKVLDIQQSVVTRWEYGSQHMCLGNFIKFCEYFDISPNELLGWEFRK